MRAIFHDASELRTARWFPACRLGGFPTRGEILRMSVKRLPLIFSILVGINGCGGVPSGQSAAPSMLPMGQSPSSLAHLRGFAATKWPINHVIIIVQENRTVDNLFNGFPGADTVTTGLTSSGKRVPLLPTGLGPPGQYDPKHGHKDSFLVEFDGGRMDGFDKLPTGSCKSNCPPNLKPYAYVPKTQAEEYWTMAQQYVLGDKMFQTNSGPSFPAHQYLISGTSVISTSSTLLAAENAFNPGGAPPTAAGCDMVPGSSVEAIDPATGIESPVFPCFDHPTLSDSLDKATLTWKYYNAWQPGKGHAEPVSTYWAPTYAINHIRHSDSMKNTITPVTEVLDDIKAGNLATVVGNAVSEKFGSFRRHGRHRPAMGRYGREYARPVQILERYRDFCYLG